MVWLVVGGCSLATIACIRMTPAGLADMNQVELEIGQPRAIMHITTKKKKRKE